MRPALLLLLLLLLTACGQTGDLYLPERDEAESQEIEEDGDETEDEEDNNEEESA